MGNETWNSWNSEGRRSRLCFFAGGVILAALASAWSKVAVAEPGEYQAASTDWNGLSGLLAIARDAGVQTRAPARIDLSELSSRDGLLLIYPAEAPPHLDLAAFMTEGGRLGVADDYGQSGELLHSFAISRKAPTEAARSKRLRGNRQLLVASASARHPLSENVDALATNHPQALQHAALDAVFALGNREALVLSGVVGQGRLVALGDPSVLINNMLQYDGNQAFADNLVRYLARDGQLWIATPQTTWVGHYGDRASGDRLDSLRAWLSRAAQISLPAPAVRLTAAVIAAFLLWTAAAALPRAKNYASAMAPPFPIVHAGAAGLVQFYAQKGRDLHAPLLTYRQEFERLVYREGHATLPPVGQSPLGRPTLGDLQITQALPRGRYAPSRTAQRARLFLAELDALSVLEGAAGHPAITARRFHALVSAGDRILGELETPNA